MNLSDGRFGMGNVRGERETIVFPIYRYADRAVDE